MIELTTRKARRRNTIEEERSRQKKRLSELITERKGERARKAEEKKYKEANGRSWTS
jgi:hypothetical protein